MVWRWRTRTDFLACCSLLVTVVGRSWLKEVEKPKHPAAIAASISATMRPRSSSVDAKIVGARTAIVAVGGEPARMGGRSRFHLHIISVGEALGPLLE